MHQIEDIDGTAVISLGTTDESNIPYKDNIEIYPYLPKEQREDILNRSNLVISRSGYSTIMDLAIIGIKALMIPTPGQIEQQYLASYLSKKGLCHQVSQHKLDIDQDITHAQQTQGFSSNGSVDNTVDNVLDIILS
jgi:UDP-N-acetylglucosamine:LPS N-acetylglucosamine transferase